MLDTTVNFFQEKQVPWSIAIQEEVLNFDVENALKERGWMISDELAFAMVIDLKNKTLINDMATAQNDIRLTNTQLDDWMLPLVEAFGPTSDDGKQYKKMHEIALKEGADWYHFTLYDDHHPVSSITLSIHDNLARIDDLGTLPAYQKKGYGTHLLNHALQEAKKRQVEYCFLEASEMGISLYQKLGFQSLFRNKIVDR